MKVPLYFKIYENYKNTTLPPTDALESEIVKMGVAPKQKGKARQAFQRSAQSADYFWSGSNRLVRPAIKGSAGAAASPVNLEEKEEPEDKGKRKKTRNVKRDSILSSKDCWRNCQSQKQNGQSKNARTGWKWYLASSM